MLGAVEAEEGGEGADSDEGKVGMFAVPEGPTERDEEGEPEGAAEVAEDAPEEVDTAEAAESASEQGDAIFFSIQILRWTIHWRAPFSLPG